MHNSKIKKVKWRTQMRKKKRRRKRTGRRRGGEEIKTETKVEAQSAAPKKEKGNDDYLHKERGNEKQTN